MPTYIYKLGSESLMFEIKISIYDLQFMAGEKLLTLSKLPFQTEELVRCPKTN